MDIYVIRTIVVTFIKKILSITNFTLFVRKKQQTIAKIFYHKKYTAEDIISVQKDCGIKPGQPIIVHSAMSNLFNFEGNADELIDKLLEYIGGPEGTLCMPAYPYNKNDNTQIFDVRCAKTAAGLLAETFRKRSGVKRSLNQLHSVCALGKDAELITKDHINSKVCFDEHSPYYIIGQLHGYSISLGLPKWYIGTGEHVCEGLLYSKLPYFREKFICESEFTYINMQGEVIKHKMLTGSKVPYIRRRNTHLVDKYFQEGMYKRVKLSNIYINVFDVKYLYTRLTELALRVKRYILLQSLFQHFVNNLKTI